METSLKEIVDEAVVEAIHADDGPNEEGEQIDTRKNDILTLQEVSYLLGSHELIYSKFRIQREIPEYQSKLLPLEEQIFVNNRLYDVTTNLVYQ